MEAMGHRAVPTGIEESSFSIYSSTLTASTIITSRSGRKLCLVLSNMGVGVGVSGRGRGLGSWRGRGAWAWKGMGMGARVMAWAWTWYTPRPKTRHASRAMYPNWARRRASRLGPSQFDQC